MPFPNGNTALKRSRFLNNFAWWLNHFWPMPKHPNLIGVQGNRDIILAVNARGYLLNFPKSNARTVLEIDGGGFLPEFAGAFNLVKPAIIVDYLTQYKETQSAITTLFVPFSIAQSLGWEAADIIADFSISLVPDQPWEANSDQKVDGTATPSWVRRLLVALPVIFGQILIFAVPLLVYGPYSFILGELSLLLAGIFLAVLWNITKVCGWLKGLLIGLVIGVFAGGVFLLTSIPLDVLLRLIVGFILCSVWLGWVYEGLRPA